MLDRCFRGAYCLHYQIALIVEAVFTSEMLVYCSNTTRCYVADGCHLHSYRRENVKSHIKILFCNIVTDQLNLILSSLITLMLVVLMPHCFSGPSVTSDITHLFQYYFTKRL
jgi:hypothetical protein